MIRFPTAVRGALRRPIVPLLVDSGSGTRLVLDALIDTGSDCTFIPKRVAQKLQLNLTSITPLAITAAFGTLHTFVPVELYLELRQSPEIYRWRSRVGVIDRPMTYAILGTSGFFDYFRIAYDWNADLIAVEPVGALPQ